MKLKLLINRSIEGTSSKLRLIQISPMMPSHINMYK